MCVALRIQCNLLWVVGAILRVDVKIFTLKTERKTKVSKVFLNNTQSHHMCITLQIFSCNEPHLHNSIWKSSYAVIRALFFWILSILKLFSSKDFKEFNE